MNKTIAIPAFAASLLVSFAVQAADTTELKVKGVIGPAACTPTLSGGGVADYGIIPASSLKAGRYTDLGIKDMSFSLVCDAASKLAIKTVDNRTSSVVKEVWKFISLSDRGSSDGWRSYLFGLGNVAGKNVGAFVAVFHQDSYTADSEDVDTISSTNGGTSWLRPTAGAFQNGWMHSWAAKGKTTPGAYQQVSGIVRLNAVVNKPENLMLNQDVPLDGSVTLEMNYL